MSDSVYLTTLHQFINEYFKTQGASIRVLNEDYFQVNHPDGKTQTYTYKPRIASENRSVELLAKGSKALQAILNKCRSESMLSQAEVRTTHESVERSVSLNTCCNLCPYHQVCDAKDGCCDFCGYYKVCNSHIKNAAFEKLGVLKESTPVTFIAYVFLVTLSNDYAIHLKTQMRMMVLLNYPDGKLHDDVMVKHLEQLDFHPVSQPLSINEQTFEKFNHQAKEALRLKLIPYMNMFRYQSEKPLQEKVASILNKYSDEYTHNFTSFSADRLEKLQDIALTYCERELRGFAVNCECSMENAFVIHTTRDKRELVFKINNQNVSLDGEIILNKVFIPCSQCGLDIDTGYLCSNGHILCSSCADICTECKKPICSFCGEEAETCEICGETLCKNCAVSCPVCDSVTCGDHHFTCKKCGEVRCFDCIELCSVCGSPYCPDHLFSCHRCGKMLCENHKISCHMCDAVLCAEHAKTCGVCNVTLCDEHAYLSSSGSMYVCRDHRVTCMTCQQPFSVSEVSACSRCGTPVCSEHTVSCNECGKPFCSEHVNFCPHCGKGYCDCTPFKRCKYCGIAYCPSCLDSKGVCTGCGALKRTDSESDVIRFLKNHHSAWGHYKNYRTGESGQMTVVLALSFTKPRIAVIHKTKGLIADRKIKRLDFIKLLGSRRYS